MPIASITAAGLLILAVGSQSQNQSTGQRPPGGGNAAGAARRQVETVLLPMASMAELQTPATSGNYWQEDTVTGLLAVAGTGAQPYLISQTASVVTSLGVHPGEVSLVLTGEDADTSPASPHDASLWRAAGSPTTVQADEPDITDQPPGAATTAPGVPQTLTIGTGAPSLTHIYSGDTIAIIGNVSLDYAELQGLQVDPDILGAFLTKAYEQTTGYRDPTTPAASQWIFDQAADLITMPVPPVVRAAAYRLMAGLPGIEDLGSATDVSGRSGVALALPTLDSGTLGSVRDELIVDPQSASLLATEQVMVTPSAEARAAGLKPGMVVDYTTIASVGWSDQQVALLAGPNG